MLLSAGLYAHVHSKTAQCLMGRVTVTMEYTALSSTAVKWRQKGYTGFLWPAVVTTQMHSSKALHDLQRKIILDGNKPQGCRISAAAQKVFRDITHQAAYSVNVLVQMWARSQCAK